MITVDQAKQQVLEWLRRAECNMNSFGSALPGYSEREHSHLVIAESETEEHDFGWVFYWNTREYIETGDIRHALGGNAPVLVDRVDGSLHVTGTARRTSEYVDEYRRKRRRNEFVHYKWKETDEKHDARVKGAIRASEVCVKYLKLVIEKHVDRGFKGFDDRQT